MLPPDVTHFTDREAELATLDALLTATEPVPSATVVISAIAGTAGMGKTSLAVHWAHRMRDQFPDGQLYVNLRGYDSAPPVPAEQALGELLRAMDVPGEAIPHGVDAMAAYYRSLLAGRRMIVVLDNVASPDQARPLLPASETCVVLVTSRSRLSGLVARDGAHRLTLDFLPADEAVALVRTIIGADRADVEFEAVAELARRCAYLPLALRIAAERVTARPRRLIADLVTDLADEQDRLDMLATDGDENTDVRAVFSWSYRALAPDAARLFRLLGLHPGRDISLPAAAALTGTTPVIASRLLDQLAGVHLLDETGPDRYRLHDLLRVYAAELAATEEGRTERNEAIGRMFAWYLHTAHAASTTLWPHQPKKPFDFQGSDGVTLLFSSRQEALDWLDSERANLMAVVHHAGAGGWHSIAWQLPLVLVDFFVQRGGEFESVAALRIGLSSSRYLQNRLAERWVLSCLGQAHGQLGRLDEAISYARAALSISRELGRRRDEGASLHNLGWAFGELGILDESTDYLLQALAIFREVGDERAEGNALSLIGDVRRKQRRFDDGLDCIQHAIAIHQRIRNRWNEAGAWLRLGHLYLDFDKLDNAINAYEQALVFLRELDDRHGTALVLRALGDTHHRAGEQAKALHAWQEALLIFEELRSPKATEVRRRLDAG